MSLVGRATQAARRGLAPRARRALVVATAIALLATLAVLIELVPATPANADVGTFTNTALCYETYTVPPGATKLTALANGAPGAPGKPSDNGINGGPGGAGGYGHEIDATFDVAPNSTLYVGMGRDSGFKGGRSGFAWGPDDTNFRGGAGGGAAWVTTSEPGAGCTVASPLIVASGGGGGGGGGHNRNQGGGFGGPGGTEGVDGGNGGRGRDTTGKSAALDNTSGSGFGGAGATASSHGPGAPGGNRETGGTSITGTVICAGGEHGDNGALLAGGRGGAANGDTATGTGTGILLCDAFGGGGGGGGGGYRSGGGGGGGNSAGRDGGGGGAGSSFTAPGVEVNSSDVGCFRQGGVCMLEKPAGVTLTPVNTAPVITSSSSTTASPGVASSFSVMTTGYRAPSLSITGAPSWITFNDFGNAKGRINIDPPQNVPGGYSVPFQLRASNSSGTANQTFTVNVLGPPRITSADHATFLAGSPNTFTITAPAFPQPTIGHTGAPLASWLSFTDNGNGTATLSGTPPTTGSLSTLPITVTATNSQGTATPQPFTLTVLNSIFVTPANPMTSLAVNSVAFTATGRYPSGGTVDVTQSSTWSSSNAGVARALNQGLVSPESAGTATITATNGPVSGSTGITVQNGTPTSMTVTPDNGTIHVGDAARQFTATAAFSTGQTRNFTALSTWQSSNPAVATVNSSGVVTPVGAGSTNISATFGSVSDSAVLTVRGDRPTSIDVSPANLIAVPGGSLQYTATGHYSSSPTSVDLTGVVDWTSSAANIVSPQSGGVFRFVRAGTATLTASLRAASGSPLTATAAVTVKNPSSIAVTAPSPTVALGATMQMVATATFADSTTADVSKSVVWFTNESNEVRLSSTGIVTGRIPGPASIVATAYPQDLAVVTGSKSITVVFGTPTSITMRTPTSGDINSYTAVLGDALPRFSAIAHYAGELGLTQDIRAAVETTWQSSNPAVATVDNGFVTPRAAGVTTITATSGSVSGSFLLTLTAGDPVSIHIEQNGNAVTLVSPGGTLQLTVTANYLGGTTADVTHDGNLQWFAYSPTVADVSPGGLVTMKSVQDRAVGQIRAQFLRANGTTAGQDIVDMTVVLNHPNALVISPATATMEAGTSRSFIATGTYENGVTADATRAQGIQWQVWDRGDLGSLSSTGLVTTKPLNAQGATDASGDMTIRATLGSQESFATITVPARKGNPTRIDVTTCAVGAPSADCGLDVAAGTTRQLTATATYSDNSTADITDQVIWTSFATSKATVSSTGLVSGLVAGSAPIDATLLRTNGSFCCSGRVDLNITLGTPLSLAMTPLTPSVVRTTTVRFTARATYRGNIVVEVTNTAAWSSSDTAKVEFQNPTSNRSVATGRATGTATVTVTFAGLTASTLVTVTNTDPDLLLVYDTEAPASAGAFCQGRFFFGDTCNTISASQAFTAGQTRHYRIEARWNDGSTDDADVTDHVGFASSTFPGNVQPPTDNPLPVNGLHSFLSGGVLSAGYFFENRTETIYMCLIRSDGQCWGYGSFRVSVEKAVPVSVRITTPWNQQGVPPDGPPPDVVIPRAWSQNFDAWGKLADGKEARITSSLVNGDTLTISPSSRPDHAPVLFYGTPGAGNVIGNLAGVSFVTARAGDATATVRVTVGNLQAPDFTAKSPPSPAVTGTPYSYQFRAKPAALDENGQPVVGGREATYTLSTGSLPPGLTLDTVTGFLAGTPTTPGSYTFNLQAANGGAPPKLSGNLTVVVNDPPDSAPAFTAASPPAGTVGAAYGPYTFTASGFPAPTLSVDSGVLPPGLTFDATTRRLEGTPTTEGSFTFRMKAANGVDPPATTPDITVTIAPAPVAPSFTASSPPPGVLNAPYSYRYAASGVPAPTFSVAPGGTPPTGLTLDSATGVLSGTPTAAGNFTFAVDAANSAGTTTSDVATVAIVSAPVFTAASPPSPATYGSPYNYTFATSGSPAATFSLASGSLPSGLSVDGATGELAGTPSETGTFTFQIGADNSPSTPDVITGQLTVVVNGPTVTVTAGSPASITYGDAAPSVSPSYSGFVNGDTAPATPPTCAAQIDASHLHNGKPVAGTYATVCSGAVDTHYTFAYLPGSLTVDPLGITVTASSPAAITYGAATPAVTPTYTSLVNGDTPAALTTQATCGAGPGATLRNGKLVPGTQPTACAGAVSPNYGFSYVEGAVQVGKNPLTITADDKARSTTQTDPPFTFHANFVNGDIASALTRPATCSVADPNTTTPGVYDITCTGAVSDLYGPITYATGDLSVTTSPVFTAASPPITATYGSPYAGYTFAASGDPTFGVASGALPAGLTLDPTTGALAGTPTAVGPSSFTVRASNGVSPDALTSTLTITVGPAQMTITASSPAAITYGTVTPPVTPGYGSFVNGDTALATPPTCGAGPAATLRNGKLVPGNQPTACAGAVDARYAIGYAAGTLHVDKAGLTITADDQGRAANATNPPLTFHANFLNGDTASALTTQPTCVANDGGTTTPGGYVISCSGAASDLYGPFTYVNGTLRVGAAPTNTTVTAGPNPAPFGTPLTLVATVAAAAVPTGTVQFSVGTVPLGPPVTLDGTGAASLTLRTVNPGLTITALYTPAGIDFATSSGSVSPAISFTQTFTGKINGDLKLTNGTFLLNGVTMGGKLTVGSGTSVVVLNSTIKNDVVGNGSNAFSMCGSKATGSVKVTGARGFVLIGGPTDHGCAPNTVNGNLTLTDNRAGAFIEGNKIGAKLTVDATSGPGGLPGDTAPKIKANTVQGNLACASNRPPPSNDGVANSVAGRRSGQCATL